MEIRVAASNTGDKKPLVNKFDIFLDKLRSGRKNAEEELAQGTSSQLSQQPLGLRGALEEPD